MKTDPAIAIVDSGVANIGSAAKAFRRFSSRVSVSEEAETIRSADGLVLPGVGAFGAGMAGLARRGLVEPIREFANSGKPLLGICLGAQLLMERSYELGAFGGLGIISGEVVPFPPLEPGAKVPHIGWNALLRPLGVEWEASSLAPVREGDAVYFVHSFLLKPRDLQDILATARYGGHEFCAAIRHGNVTGMQFHPEKSGSAGLAIIEQFTRLMRIT